MTLLEGVVPSDRRMGNELCRICFSKKSTFLNVFETSVSNEMTIADMFVKFLGENMYPDDDLPDYICCDCMEEVIGSANINEACKAAVRHSVWRTRLLKESLKEKKSTRSPMIAFVNFLSEGNEDTKKKAMEGCKDYYNILPTIYQTETSYPSANSDEKSKKGNVSKLNRGNCSEPYILECSVCRGVFLNAEDLMNHKTMFHKVGRGFHCGKCHRKFKTMKNLEKHIEKTNFTCKSHNGITTEKNVVNSSPSSSTEIEKRLKGSLKKNANYSCSICHSSPLSERVLKLHLREIHSSTFPCLCKSCGLGFISRIDLELHKEIHPKEYSCQLCKREFFTSRFYERHVKFCQEGIAAHKCRICGKETSSKVNLGLHMSTHSLKKRFECQVCHKKFFRGSHLYGHQRSVHLKLKPHVCEICRKSFSLRGQLVRHRCRHSDERPYGCSLCEKRFKVRFYLSCHERRIHKIIRPQKVNIIVDEHVLANISGFQ